MSVFVVKSTSAAEFAAVTIKPRDAAVSANDDAVPKSTGSTAGQQHLLPAYVAIRGVGALRVEPDGCEARVRSDVWAAEPEVGSSESSGSGGAALSVRSVARVLSTSAPGARAAMTYAEAERLKPNDPGILMAEAQAWMTGLQISDPIPDRAIDLLRRVQALDPTSQAALWYLGLHAAQSGEFAEARADWEKLLPLMPGDSDERKTVMAALAAIKNK